MLNTGIAFEIVVNIVLRFSSRDAELISKTEGGNPINNAEVNGFRAPPHHGIHVFDGQPEHFRSGHGVNVDPVFKRLLHGFQVCDMRQQSQFDLTIIGGDQNIPVFRNECSANLSSIFRPYGNVLQIGIG